MKQNIKITIIIAMIISSPILAKESDRNQPVYIEADQAEFIQEKKQTLFSGNVIIKQGSLEILAAKVQSHQQTDKGQWVEAFGKPVHFRQEMDEKRKDGTAQWVSGYADRIIFDSSQNLVTLKDNALINRDGDKVSGETITYNTQTAIYRVNGKKGKRVSVILKPNTVKGQ